MSETKPVAVRVPQETVNDEQVRLVSWRAKEGDKLEVGAVVADIETSKSVLEVTAGSSGHLRRTAEEGDWIPVGGIFCYLTAGPDDALPAEESKVGSAASEGPAFSRKARALVEAEGIAPSAFAGMSMVREADVKEFLEKGAQAAAKGVSVRKVALTPRKRSENAALLGGGANVLRSLVALRCSEKAYRSAAEKSAAFSATPSGLILFEAARVLAEKPLFNSFYSGDAARLYGNVNPGFVIDGDNGLRVPVILDADKKDEEAVAVAIQDLLLAYHENELTPEQESGGTFTITDLSGEGVSRFEPLINAAQSAILGVAAPVDGSFELCLAFDHRLHEGRSAAGFLKSLIARIEARA